MLIILINSESSKAGYSMCTSETYFSMESIFCISEINVWWFRICWNKETSRYLILFTITLGGRIKPRIP